MYDMPAHQGAEAREEVWLGVRTNGSMYVCIVRIVGGTAFPRKKLKNKGTATEA